MNELNVNVIEQVNGAMSTGEGMAAVDGVIAIAAAAPIIGSVAVIAGLGGMIAITAIDIFNTLSFQLLGFVHEQFKYHGVYCSNFIGYFSFSLFL